MISSAASDRLRRQAIVAVALVAGLLAAAVRGQITSPAGPTQSSAAAAATVTVVGRVVQADGKTPIASATVSLNAMGAAPNQADRVLTDGEGRFFFSSVPVGPHALTADKPGYQSGAYGQHRPGGTSVPLDLTSGQTPGPITLVLWKSAVLTGRVLNDAGDPMVDVAIRAARLQFVAGHRQLAEMTKTRTDDRGVYRFSALQPGSYVVVVVSTITSEPSSYAGTVRQNGDLPHAYLQTMTAVGSAPLVTYDAVTGLTTSPRVLATSALGVASTPTADAAWMAYPTTYLPSATSLANAAVFRAEPGGVVNLPDLQVRLTATYAVSGEVMAPDGPAASFAVHLLQSESADLPLFDAATAVTDANGAFTFYGVPPGQYVARVVRTPWPSGGRGLVVASRGGDSDSWVAGSGPGRGGVGAAESDPVLSASASITVGSRGVTGLALTLKPGPHVRGRVQFNGSAPQPTPAAMAALAVTLVPVNGLVISPAAASPGRFDSNGDFVIPSSWPTRYVIRATAPQGWTFDGAMHDGRDVSETPIDLTSDLDDVVIVYTDHPVHITGTVEFTEGDAVNGADVLIFPADPAGWVDYGRTSRRVRLAQTSSSRAFSLAAPPAGDYYLVAVPDADTADWEDSAFLKKAAGAADRVTIIEGQSFVHNLHVRHIQ